MMMNSGAVLMIVFVWFLAKWTPGSLTSISDVGDFIGGPKPESFTGWGMYELIPPIEGGTFVRIHVPDMTMEEAKTYTGIIFDDDGKPAVRRGQLNIIRLAPVEVHQLERTGELEIPASTFMSVTTRRDQ